MRVRIKMEDKEKSFIRKVAERSAQNIYACYQCGRCSAGCPFAFEMDILPNQIIRLVQLGQEEEVSASKAVYLCASCFTCHSRCPKGIDIARIAEAIREITEPKGQDHFGPDDVPLKWAKDLPQQAYVAVFKKFSK